MSAPVERVVRECSRCPTCVVKCAHYGDDDIRMCYCPAGTHADNPTAVDHARSDDAEADFQQRVAHMLGRGPE